MKEQSKIIISDNTDLPFSIFKKLYYDAIQKDQPNADAMAISTSNNNNVVSSRFVNLKYIVNNELIFFTNYNSPKFTDIKFNPNVSCLIYWQNTNVQIRICGKADASSNKISDKHFDDREYSKNVAAISSNQSKTIESYERLMSIYEENLKKYSNALPKRPNNWGGVSIKPSYFEFWYGSNVRLNKRECFCKVNDLWQKSILQP